jgi:Fe2+ or Zn2+ uptake regulation protein
MLPAMQYPETMHRELWLYRFSRTRQRERIYLVLGRIGPCRPVELAKELVLSTSKRTIYRTIQVFLNAGIARELPGGLIELMPPFQPKRHYIICRSCSRRTPFQDEALERLLAGTMDRHEYVLPMYQVELSGLCPLCAERI